LDSCITSVSELIGDDMKAATYRSPNCIKKTDKQTKGQTDGQHQCIKSSLTPPALPPLGHIGDVVLVWRKESINKTVSMLHIMYYYNGAQRYEQFFQVYRLYRFLILLGLTLCLPSTSVSLVFMMLYTCIYTVFQKKFTVWLLVITSADVDQLLKILSPGDSQEKSLCTHHKDSHLTCNMLWHYLVRVENSKNVTDFDSTSTDCWHVPEDTLRTWFNI